ncbi:TonB-dependent receptor plug domain-containing protein [Horticoccus sp. 23ND18S-11]|uniref:TonB-dependent receptor plug domain-containing protein n=1 Tax=Horticoccus sp. 23ND18S-11 TaxID=3391832 RepID=UPI0039C9109D
MKPRYIPTIACLLSVVVILTNAPTVLAQSPTANEVSSDVIALSPFEVSTSKDRGYEAGETLSGTRLSTPSRFVGAAVTDVTAALIQDLALTNMQDLINFVPNSASYFGGGLSGDSTGNNSLFGISYYVRGNLVTSASRDFIKYRVYEDAYNVERFSFARGPNSILFGIGDPAGIVNSVSKRAQYRDANNVGFRFDTNDSSRATFDLNKQVVAKRLAVRIAGLHENRETDRKPSDRKSDRIYGALTANPFRSTTVRASAEKGHYDALNVRPWPAADGLTPWIQAGRQEIPAQLRNGAVNNATGTPATPGAVYGVGPSAPGVVGAAPSGYLGLLGSAGFAVPRNFPYAGLTFGGSVALPISPLNMNGLIYPIRPFQYGATGERSPTLLNAPIPYTANVLGHGNRLVQDFDNHLVSVEQSIGRDLFIEAVYSRQHIAAINDYSSQNVDNIFIDKNPTLLGINGSTFTNPNYNRYFVINDQPTSYEQRYIDTTYRATASYKLDFKRHVKSRWGEWLGYHNFAGLVEKTSADFVQHFAFLRNTNNAAMAGVPQFPAAGTTNIQSANNMVAVINYLDPQKPETWAFPDLYPRYPHLLFDGSAKPAPDATGLAPAWVVNSSTRSLQEINSKMVVMQNVLLQERLITTFGWRNDRSATWNPPAAAINAAGGGYVKNILDTPVKSVNAVRKSGSTRTQGVVAYPLNWIGLTYNQSNNFQPAAGGLLDIFGNTLPNSEGKGRDYGIKYRLWDGRISGSFSYFTTTTANLATTQLRSGPAGSIDTGRAAIRSRMANLLPDDPYWLSTTYPWNNNYRNLNDNESKGYEFTVTANPLRNWRVTANLSRQRTAASNVGGFEREFLAQARALFAAGGKYAAYANETTGGSSITQWLDDIQNVLTRSKSLEGRADARQPRYTARLSTAYDFVEGRLKNWGVGATYQWSKALVVGYPYLPGNPGLFDANRPYLGDDVNMLGAFASYRFKVLKRYNCRAQLNVDNLTGEDDLHPIVKVDRGDGQPVVSRYSLAGGRNFVLSGSIEF